MRTKRLGLAVLTLSGTKLKKFGNYNVTYNGTEISFGGVAVLHADSADITLLFKSGSSFYVGKVGVSQTDGTVVATKKFSIDKTDIDFGGVSKDLSAWVEGQRRGQK